MAGADDLRHEMSERTNILPYVPHSKSSGRREIVCLWALGGWIRRDERAGRLGRVCDWDGDLG